MIVMIDWHGFNGILIISLGDLGDGLLLYLFDKWILLGFEGIRGNWRRLCVCERDENSRRFASMNLLFSYVAATPCNFVCSHTP